MPCEIWYSGTLVHLAFQTRPDSPLLSIGYIPSIALMYPLLHTMTLCQAIFLNNINGLHQGQV